MCMDSLGVWAVWAGPGALLFGMVSACQLQVGVMVWEGARVRTPMWTFPLPSHSR